MRFTPVRVGQEIESCVTVGAGNAQGAVSQSINCGSVNWDIFIYSSSVYLGGGGAEGFTFEIAEGRTNRAIVAVVGGGGGTSSDSRCGGGGALNYQTDLFLEEGITYAVSVGEGAVGTDRGAPGAPFSGDNGQQSRFLGGVHDITADGGDGGVQGGTGGDSGNGNTSSGLGGAGAGAGTNSAWAGVGRTVGLGNLSVGIDYVPILRAGGGAGDGLADKSSGVGYGGGDNSSATALVNGTTCFGGGAGGGQFFDNSDNRYKSSPAGSGCIMIAIPTNLCTGSIYVEKPVVRQNLLHYWDVTNARTVGKDAGTTLIKDLRRISNLRHSTTKAPTSADTASFYFYTDDRQINNLISDETFVYLDREYNGTVNEGPEDFLSCSIDLDISTNWSFDIIYENDRRGNLTKENPLTISSSTDGSHITLEALDSGDNSKLIYTEAGSSPVDSTEVNTGQDKLQSVITYDGTDLKWYVNTVLEDTLTLALTSSLDNPKLFVNMNGTGLVRGETKFSELRVYNTELTPAQIEQNYSASFGL